MMEMHYTRAVPTRDCHAIVYAHRLTRQDAVGSWLDERHFVLCMCGETHIARIGSWVVWHPLSVEFELVPDDEFNERFTLYENLPPNVRALADKHPCYDDWVDMENGVQTGKRQ